MTSRLWTQTQNNWKQEWTKKTVLILNIHINTKSKARAKNSNTSKLQGDTEQGDARPWGTIWQGKRTDSNNRFKITKGKVAGGSIAEDTCTSRILGTIRWCWCFPDLCVYVCVCRSKWKFCYKEAESSSTLRLEISVYLQIRRPERERGVWGVFFLQGCQCSPSSSELTPHSSDNWSSL